MQVFRISKKSYINDLSGVGAGLYGARWNPKGINLCYTSGSIALAYLEFFIHNYHILSSADLCLAKIKVNKPEPLVEILIDDLPDQWDSKLRPTNETQGIGKQFALNVQGYILKVPSAIVPGEFNYLLNPFHENHSQTVIKELIDPLTYDSRLVHLIKK